jgi:putative peptidoglycan lipid II flippase
MRAVAFAANDVQQTTHALMGYGAGLIGIVAIKVLAPGFYASQDIRTPVRIAIMVLVITQLMNIVLVPLFAHAGLTLAISLGALVNAGALLFGLMRRRRYMPAPGWPVFAFQVLGATLLMSAFLLWGARRFDWLATPALPRVGLLAAWIAGAALIYFGALAASGVRLRQLLRR